MTDLPDTSPNLGLPFYLTKQNEFEVQHNEALLILDALVMLSVLDRDLSSPPAEPALGDRYIVKAPGEGAFAGQDNRIAQYDVGGWNFYAPREGWTCYVRDEQALLAWNGESWGPAVDVPDVTELQNMVRLGVGTEADETNPFAAKLNNALWVARSVAEGGDGTLRYKLSKESAVKTLSMLFQTAYEGRAEIGLTGDDDFHVKVSADGETWRDAIVIDHATGAVSMPHTPPAVPADLDVTLAALALGLSDALNCAQFLGSSGNRVADSFDALTYVDVAGATNLDSGTAGVLKPLIPTVAYTGHAMSGTDGTSYTFSNMAAGAAHPSRKLYAVIFVATSGSISGVTIGGIAATQLFVTGSLRAAIFGVAAPTGTTATVEVTLGSSATRCYCFLFRSLATALAAAMTVTESSANPHNLTLDIPARGIALGISYHNSTGPITWANLTEASAGDVSVENTTASAAADYFETAQTGRAITATAGATAGGTNRGAAVAIAPAINMIVGSTAFTAAIAPTAMKLVAQTKHVDSITLGTDLIFEVSRDNGTTWTAATMSDRFTVGALHVLESGTVDLSAQPSGTQVKWRARSQNNKFVELHGVYLYWN